jgi:sec-independent protein translocase protein TatB
MFNLGFGEILVICVVLIIVVGPERLPAVMKNVGKAMRTVRQASREIQSTVGLDELWNEDVLAPPRPRVPPPSTVSRQPEQISPGSPQAPAPATPEPPAGAAPASADAPVIAPVSDTAPALRGGASDDTAPALRGGASSASEPAAGDAHVNGSGGTKGDG